MWLHILCYEVTFIIIFIFMYTDLKTLNGYHHTLPGASNLIMGKLLSDLLISTSMMVMWFLCLLGQVKPLSALNICVIFMLPSLFLRMILEFKAPDELYTVTELSLSPHLESRLMKEKHKKVMRILVTFAFIADLIICILSVCQFIITKIIDVNIH